MQGHEDVEGEQQAAPEIAHRVAKARYQVVFRGLGHVQQQRIVADDAAPETERGNDVERGCPQPMALRDQGEPGGGGGAQHGAHQQQSHA